MVSSKTLIIHIKEVCMAIFEESERKEKTNISRLKRYAACFVLGAIGYAAIEIIWRGRTHWSMMIAGGICFIIFSIVAETMQDKGMLLKAVVCALGVTVVEFIFGLVFNLWLGMGVWDYSNMPLNLMGQICPLFSLMWVGVAIVFLPLAGLINEEYA